MRMRTVMAGRSQWQALTREAEGGEEVVAAWEGEVAAAMVAVATTVDPMALTMGAMGAW
jgi:hypothetical protein